MSPVEQLKSIITQQYISEDGERYNIELKEGMSRQQINELAAMLPTGKIPDEIRELLNFAAGFTFFGLEGVDFNTVGHFGFEEFFPHSVQLAGDGFGNFWILDISRDGNWGPVFYVCHDPAVIVKHSNDLAEFIVHIDEFGKNETACHLTMIHEKAAKEIWDSPNGFTAFEDAKQASDPILKNFAFSISENFVIADLRNKPNQAGFAWGRFGSDIKSVKRHDTELIWAVEKPIRKSILSKLFSRF